MLTSKEKAPLFTYVKLTVVQTALTVLPVRTDFLSNAITLLRFYLKCDHSDLKNDEILRVECLRFILGAPMLLPPYLYLLLSLFFSDPTCTCLHFIFIVWQQNGAFANVCFFCYWSFNFQ